MKKANRTGVTSRGTQIATLERALAQLLSQLTALQTRVGALEACYQGHQDTLARLTHAVAALGTATRSTQG
jgi:hypothetical protein